MLTDIVRKHIAPADYADQIIRTLPHGVFLTSCAHGRLNTMVIGWGSVGIEWGVPIFTACIRSGRFTRELLDENPEFTVSLPPQQRDASVVRFCGAHSGRNVDKFAHTGLTPTAPEVISVPAIKEFPLTFECRVVHRYEQPLDSINSAFLHYYPQDIPGSDCGRNKDPHIIYRGQIVSAYIIENPNS